MEKLNKFTLLLIILPSILFAANSQDIAINFTRHLDPGGTEGYKIDCKSEKCTIHVMRNNKSVESKSVSYQKAKSVADEYSEKLESISRTPSSGPPLLSYEINSNGKLTKGYLPLSRELRKDHVNPQKDRLVLGLEYRLIELSE